MRHLPLPGIVATIAEYGGMETMSVPSGWTFARFDASKRWLASKSLVAGSPSYGNGVPAESLPSKAMSGESFISRTQRELADSPK